MSRADHINMITRLAWIPLAGLFSFGACEVGDSNPLNEAQEGLYGFPITTLDKSAVEGKIETKELWTVTRDNPVLVGKVQLSSSDQSLLRGPIGSSALDTTEYHLFDHYVNFSGPLNSSVVTQTYETRESLPQAVGKAYGPGQFDWEVHGIRLAPRMTGAANESITSAEGLFQDPYAQGTIVTMNTSTFIQLDKKIPLVPLHVVQFYIAGGSSYPNGWFSQDKAALVFDDVWAGHKQTVTNPNQHPNDVLDKWTNKPKCDTTATLPMDSCSNLFAPEPDDIWAQCGIQVRMVDYFACPVAAKVFYDPLGQLATGHSGQCSTNTAAMSRIESALKECGVPEDGTLRIVFLGEITECSASGTTLGLTSTHFNIAALANQFTDSGVTIAHELGHALGIAGDYICSNNGTNNPNQLMCATGNGTTILQSECNTALGSAYTGANARQLNWP